MNLKIYMLPPAFYINVAHAIVIFLVAWICWNDPQHHLVGNSAKLFFRNWVIIYVHMKALRSPGCQIFWDMVNLIFFTFVERRFKYIMVIEWSIQERKTFMEHWCNFLLKRSSKAYCPFCVQQKHVSIVHVKYTKAYWQPTASSLQGRVIVHKSLSRYLLMVKLDYFAQQNFFSI